MESTKRQSDWHDQHGAVIDTKRAEAAGERQRELNAVQARLLACAAGQEGAKRDWFVIRVAKRQEKTVDEALREAGLETWFPLRKIKIEVRFTRRRRNVERPIWLGYLFVRVVPCAEAWAGLAAVRGVSGILGCDGVPASVDDEKLNALRGLVKAGAFDMKRAAVPFAPGSKVMITEGPFQGFSGVVDGYVGTRAVRVLASLFGRQVPIALDLAQITK